MSDGLSMKEQVVLSLLLQGLSIKEIGLALSISSRTVQKHLQLVYQHLGVQSRVEARARLHQRALRFSAGGARTARQQAGSVVSGRHEGNIQRPL